MIMVIAEHISVRQSATNVDNPSEADKAYSPYLTTLVKRVYLAN